MNLFKFQQSENNFNRIFLLIVDPSPPIEVSCLIYITRFDPQTGIRSNQIVVAASDYHLYLYDHNNGTT